MSKSYSQNSKLESYLTEFKKVFPQLESKNWDIHSGHKNEDEVIIDIISIKNDTTYNYSLRLNFITDNENNWKRKIYTITRYWEIYKSNNTTHFLHYFENELLYHYYVIDNKHDEKDYIFMYGKYIYAFKNHLFDKNQIEFYQLNKDSLNLIKGNPIIKLNKKLTY